MHQLEKEKSTYYDLDETHDQVFNWINAKASSTSTTFPLKITLFLCLQTSLTTVIQIPSQTSSFGALLIEKFNNGTL